MTTKTVDKWTAAQCGVDLQPTPSGAITRADHLYWTRKTDWFTYPWTIKDPRCCEIFRNWWLSKDTSNAVLFFCDEVTYFRDYAYGQGDPTTRDTEEACITAIYEASQ